MEQPTDPQSIARHCIELIAKAKQRPEESITLETTLEELQIDSLDKVSLGFDFEEDYGLVVPESAMADVHTVGDIVARVQAAIAERQAPPETA